MPAPDIQRSAIPADVRLSKYNPLPRVLFHDDFDEGVNGWCELVGNHAGDLNDIREVARDFRPPQLSNCTFFDIGTHGSVDGTYSLKLATRPKANHSAIAIKRMTSARRGLVQLETYFAFKAEQTFDGAGAEGWDGNAAPSERQFGDITFCNDICESRGGLRYHGVVRYRNTEAAGALVQTWMCPTSVEPTTKMERQGAVGSNRDFHSVNPEDWLEDAGRAPAALLQRDGVEGQLALLAVAVRHLPAPQRRAAVQRQRHGSAGGRCARLYDEPYQGLPNLLNFYVAVRTHTNVRNFLYLDSALVSVDW